MKMTTLSNGKLDVLYMTKEGITVDKFEHERTNKYYIIPDDANLC